MKASTDFWMAAAGRYPLLCKTTTLRLARTAQDETKSDKVRRRAMDRLCLHNLRLVITTVRRYVDKCNGLTWRSEIVSDLLQSGYFGLRRAVELFDTTKKIRFSTYATLWINQHINRCKNANQSLIHVPEKAMYDVYHWMQTGEMRTGKKNQLSADGQRQAIAAMFPSSLDAFTNTCDGDRTIVETISEDNRLIHNSKDNSELVERVHTLLREAGIRDKDQQFFLYYMKRGNIQVACSKARITQANARQRLEGIVAKLKALA